ncbi:hypothetical protein V6N13_060942 [Hibiscus sabdariffa]
MASGSPPLTNQKDQADNLCTSGVAMQGCVSYLFRGMCRKLNDLLDMVVDNHSVVHCEHQKMLPRVSNMILRQRSLVLRLRLFVYALLSGHTKFYNAV